MKKILFLIDNLGGGGAEKVLCDIVKNLDKSKYDITVCTVWDTGIYIDEIKNNVKYTTLFKELKESNSIYKKVINFIRQRIRVFITQKVDSKLLYRLLIRKQYDIEIAFLEVLATKIISGSNNKKSKKYAWVHTDLEKHNWPKKIYGNIAKQRDAYEKFDKIMFVSDDAKKGFERKFNIRNRLYVQYNPIDEKAILNLSIEQIDDIELNSKFRIITVGRLVEQKGYDRLLKVHNKLTQEGFCYELWILGDGNKLSEYKKFILEHNLSDTVKLLGFKKNPYKYIKQADLFICSSRTEGFSLVIAEALVIGIPVISTNCSGPVELLDNGLYGKLVKNNEESIYKGIKEILNDKLIYNYYKDMAKKRGQHFKLRQRITEIEKLLDEEE